MQTVAKTVADAGEALDLAITLEEAAAKTVARLAVSPEHPPGFEWRFGALRIMSGRRRQFQKATAALDAAKTRRQAALASYRATVFDMLATRAEQKTMLADAIAKAGAAEQG